MLQRSEPPILTYEEITSVQSIDALTKLYAGKGHSFSGLEDVVSALKADWKKETKRVWADALSKDAPTKLPSLDVVAGGVRYQIYGIAHRTTSGPEYRRMIYEAMQGENCLFEENMKFVFPKLRGRTMPDQLAANKLSLYELSLVFGITLPIVPLEFAYRLLRFKKSLNNDLKELNAPCDVWFNMPAYVRVELAERLGWNNAEMPGITFGLSTRRSAYQAEFMKAWRAGQDKKVLVGAGHAKEIEYFLTHGVKDREVVGLAQKHAGLAETGGIKYTSLLAWSIARTHGLGNIGVIVGGAPLAILLAFGPQKIYAWMKFFSHITGLPLDAV